MVKKKVVEMNIGKLIIFWFLLALTVAWANSAKAGVTITKVDKITFINLTGAIVHDIKPYQPILKVLASAKRGDTVILNITSPGGSVRVGMIIANALKSSKAYTVSSVPTMAYSMGAYLTCYTDRLSMNPGSSLMFHHGSRVMSGRWTIIGLKKLVEADLKESSILNNQCKKKGIMNNKNIYLMDQGKDVYISSSVLNKRLANLKKS